MKKLTSLFMSGILSITLFTGCSDNENTVEYKEENKQEQQVEEQEEVEVEEPKQEEKVEDEDLNKDYEYQARVNDADKAEELLRPILDENFGVDGYTILKGDGWISINLHLEESDLANATIDEWNDVVYSAIEAQIATQNYIYGQGLDVIVGLTIGDTNREVIYLGIIDGEVVFDVVNGIDKLN